MSLILITFLTPAVSTIPVLMWGAHASSMDIVQKKPLPLLPHTAPSHILPVFYRCTSQPDAHERLPGVAALTR
jgi:hypothetical protein